MKKSSEKKCVELAKKIARMMAFYKCEYCGQGEPQKRTHGSHVYGTGTYRSMGGDVDNILCLCATHHIGGFWKNSKEPSWHEDPMTMVDWFKKKFPQRAEELRLRAQAPQKIDWDLKLKELQEQLRELEKIL